MYAKQVKSDPAERARRVKEMGRRMEALRAKDPGGDLEL